MDTGEASKKPSSNPFKQQKLRAWQPILTPKAVIISFLVIGIIFIPVGVVLLVASNSVVQVESAAYELCPGNALECPIVTITFPNLNMQPPIFMYYKLENFYQNHRRYVKSRSDDQLRGMDVTSRSALVDCKPYDTFNDSSAVQDFFLPCGLIARSQFNDTFTMTDENGTVVPLSMENIAWQSDVQTKFNNPKPTTQGIRVIPDFKNPDFVNWMRTAGLPTFRKLYRVIDQPLVGSYNITIQNNFPVTSFGGHKFVVLSTTSWLGGKNPFLGYAYIVVGSICIILGLIFALKQAIRPRAQGDTAYLEWAR